MTIDQVLMWAIGGEGAAVLAALAWLAARTGREVENLWSRINQVAQDAHAAQLAAVQAFVTKEDLRNLGDRMERRFEEHERRMVRAIAQRGPIQDPP